MSKSRPYEHECRDCLVEWASKSECDVCPFCGSIMVFYSVVSE